MLCLGAPCETGDRYKLKMCDERHDLYNIFFKYTLLLASSISMSETLVISLCLFSIY